MTTSPKGISAHLEVGDSDMTPLHKSVGSGSFAFFPWMQCLCICVCFGRILKGSWVVVVMVVSLLCSCIAHNSGSNGNPQTQLRLITNDTPGAWTQTPEA